MTHPDQVELLRAGTGLLPGAVEEILRMAVPSGGRLSRYAQADIDCGGMRIRSGDAVRRVDSIANRDPAAFADPGRFDVTRDSNRHLFFGHGSHYCAGAGLARLELQAVFEALIRRLPALRPAVPVDQRQLRTDQLTGGRCALPVVWRPSSACGRLLS